jgi:hypothetical protein
MNNTSDSILFEQFKQFVASTSSDFKLNLMAGGHLSLCNSGRRGDIKEFNLGLVELKQIFTDIVTNIDQFAGRQNYEEKDWRDLGGSYFSNRVASSLIMVQTKPVFTALAKTIHWATGKPTTSYTDGLIDLDLNSLKSAISALQKCIDATSPKSNVTPQLPISSGIGIDEKGQSASFLVKDSLTENLCFTNLPKPFLLLAGISGTGKTRFVREQAKAAAVPHGMTKGENHCLVPARPDWHEPSDLLGYISRIGSGGARYVTTDLLRFIVSAWKHVARDASTQQITHKALNTICPYWLCLDEMNLAPVEQYFADYLSILETRNWKDGTYSCEPLLKPAVINQQLDEAGRNDLWENLGVSDDDPLSMGLRDYFIENGIPLPPNLIVAGTVNMDETTHGFSRKVIDRALTLDFGEFFPNDYQHYFENDKENAVKLLGFPHLSEINKKDDLAGVAADPEGGETILFLTAVNGVLAGTPFELAYRALNEALLAVVCFNPADESELQAVWDDFLMMKVLPRIEGDAEKLGSQDDKSLLTRLVVLLNEQFSKIIDGRRDLLNQSLADGSPLQTECRSLKKLAWMQKRLTDNGFTSFWP